MRAGFGKSDITPNLGVELCGYGYDLGRRAKGVMDRLHASCIAFEGGGERYLILSCDAIGFGDRVIGDIKARIHSEFGIGGDGVMLAATHTHTGPGVKKYTGCGEPDEAYLDSLPEKIALSAGEALNDLHEVEYVRRSQKEIEAIGYNRSVRGGPEDHYVRGVLIKRTDAPDIALASYPCHPVTLGAKAEISADYPGQAADALSAMGMRGMFVTGICGDIDPARNLAAWGSGTPEVIREYGERIARGFAEGLGDIAYVKDFSHAIIEVEVPLEPFDKSRVEKTAGDILGSAENAGYRRVVGVWREAMLAELEAGEKKCETGTAHVFSIGDFMLVGLNYEAATVIGMKIRGAFPGKTVVVAGNTDDIRGYFPSDAMLEAKTYEAWDSMFLYRRFPVAKGAADMFAEDVVRGIGN